MENNQSVVQSQEIKELQHQILWMKYVLFNALIFKNNPTAKNDEIAKILLLEEKIHSSTEEKVYLGREISLDDEG